jgi:DNA mismatch repair protein MutS
MASESQLTPMMAQYRRIKSELPPDALLLFRLGDFYEMFFEDAQTGAQLLNVALTKRGVIPMCGIPFHAANAYIGRLLKSGRKVAICDQVEDARPGQLVKREITRILSPGTHFDERILLAERNNFLAAINPIGAKFGLALADLTTGDFLATEVEGETALLAELFRLRPAEIIYPMEAGRLRDVLTKGIQEGTSSHQTPFPSDGHQGGSGQRLTPRNASGWVLNGYDEWVFGSETCLFTVRDHFKVVTLDGLGLKDRAAATGAVGAILHYLSQHLRRETANLTRLVLYHHSDFLTVDSTTFRHLEVFEPLQSDSPRHSSLCGAMDRTITPMGARRLRAWLSQPLSSLELILKRQAVVQIFLECNNLLESFRSQLAQVRDLERILGRLSSGTGTARDLGALRTALEQIPGLKKTLAEFCGQETHSETNLLRSEEPLNHLVFLKELDNEITELPSLVELIARAIVEEPPLALKEGGLIRDGFDPALDELRTLMRGGKDWIAKLQQDEITRTGIPSLKVRFNSVFGYYIEITKANLDKVPSEYVRKQTIANGERFITPELKTMEGKILGAEERSVKLEYELFQRVREEVLGSIGEIQRTAGALAQFDVLGAFAETARLFNYARPQIGNDGVLSIREGRHPVLEQGPERFVPNDVELSSGVCVGEIFSVEKMPAVGSTAPAKSLPQIMLITGPNMAGKSTFIRQAALLTLMAHTGAFVPARAARIDLVDRIFTRIGASDDLSRGQSTFMVEMCETANILNNATRRSLVILDEIGRGTSTFDGLSLAWSIVEHLHNQIGAKTLFATHYHELTELAARLPRLKNFNVAVREWHDQIVFLRKIVEGGTDKSYGIQVARLAGVPKSVLERAKEILRNLEESELTPEGNVRHSTRRERDREKLRQLAVTPQMDLFS